MRKKVLIIVGLCVLSLFFSSFDFQNSDAGVVQYLKRIEGYISESFSRVEMDLGAPDEIASDGQVWTYFVRNKSGDKTGYRQFANWNGSVGCFGERNFIPEEEVVSLYQRVLNYMREGGGNPYETDADDTPFDFTENHRLLQREKTMWEVDMLPVNPNANIALFIYDEEKRACYLKLLIEAKRIESHLGL